MPSDIQDFIGTFLQLKQAQNQTAQVAETARRDTLDGVNSFLTLARQTAHPGQLAALADRFSQLGVGTPEQLTSLLQNVTPTEEAVRSAQTQFGINIAAGDQSGTEASRNLAQDTASAALTGQNRGQRAVAGRQAEAIGAVPAGTPFGDFLDKAFASETLAGLTPGGATIDALMLGLPTNELTQAAGVKVGTRLSAGQNAELQSDKAKTDLGWATLSNQSAYQAATLGLDEAKLKLMIQQAKNKGVDPGDFVAAINAKTALLKNIQDAKNKNPTEVELNAYVGGLNAINQRLQALGLPYEPPLTSGAKNLRSSFDNMIESWFQRGTRK